MLGEGALGLTGEGKLGLRREALLRLTEELEVPLLPKALESVPTLAVSIPAVMLGLAAVIGAVPELPPGAAMLTGDPMLELLPAWLLPALTAGPVGTGTGVTVTALLLEDGAFAIGFAVLSEAGGALLSSLDVEGTAGLLWVGSRVPTAADGVEEGVLWGLGETPCALVAEGAAKVGTVAGGEARGEEEGNDEGASSKEGEGSEADEKGEADGEKDEAGNEEGEAGGEEVEAGGEEVEAGGEEDKAGGEEDAVGGEEDAVGGEEDAAGGEEVEAGGEEDEAGKKGCEVNGGDGDDGEMGVKKGAGLAGGGNIADALPAVGEGLWVTTEGVGDEVLLEGGC